jgi:hypothetical protein
MVEFRPATRQDVATFASPRFTVRAIAAECDGEVLGLAGVYYERGVAIAFSAIDPRLGKRDRIRGARLAMQIISSVQGPVIAAEGPYETAPTLLAHFGFQRQGDSDFWVRWPQ